MALLFSLHFSWRVICRKIFIVKRKTQNERHFFKIKTNIFLQVKKRKENVYWIKITINNNNHKNSIQTKNNIEMNKNKHHPKYKNELRTNNNDSKIKEKKSWRPHRRKHTPWAPTRRFPIINNRYAASVVAFSCASSGIVSARPSSC